MTEQDRMLYKQEAEMAHIVEALNRQESQLTETNKKLTQISETLGALKVYEEKLRSAEFRIESLEKSRWHTYTLIIGGFAAALFKLLYRG